MKTLADWVRLPTNWIRNGGLTAFTWKAGAGADQIVALMLLLLIAHEADQGTGEATVTYDALSDRAACSRAKIAKGLALLETHGIVSRKGSGRSSFALVGYDPFNGWGKLPAKRLYRHETVTAFRSFKLRHRTELDAMKIYLLMIAYRDNESNVARISYVKIKEKTGISAPFIAAALSFLSVNALIYTERAPSGESEYGVSHAYRIAGIDPFRHRGTKGAVPVEDEFIGH